MRRSCGGEGLWGLRISWGGGWGATGVFKTHAIAALTPFLSPPSGLPNCCYVFLLSDPLALSV